jgi:hypothetical protein
VGVGGVQALPYDTEFTGTRRYLDLPMVPQQPQYSIRDQHSYVPSGVTLTLIFRNVVK